MTDQTSIANRALQLLGDSPILSIDDASTRAKEMKRAYDPVRRDLIRKYPWNFARKRAILAPDTTAPLHGFTYAYTWPSDCLRVLVQNDTDSLDWTIEGKKILTDTGPTLDVIYLKDEEDPNQFDVSFVEALSAKIALETAEKITGNVGKWEKQERAYMDAIREARRMAAFEQQSEIPPEDTWLTARL